MITFDYDILKQFEGVTDKDKEDWRNAYPNVDLWTAFLQMAQWLLADKKRAKKNYRKFIVNWLSKNQREKETLLSLSRRPEEAVKCVVCKQPVRSADSEFCKSCGFAYDNLPLEVKYNRVRVLKFKLPMVELEKMILAQKANQN